MSHSSFHLSLTVLVHYRTQGVFSLRKWPSWIHPTFLRRVTWGIRSRYFRFRLQDFHFLWSVIPNRSATLHTPFRAPQPLALWARNTKSQITKYKQIRIFKIQNTKHVSNFSLSNFDIVCYLVLDACYFLVQRTRFRLFRFRSPLLTESLLFYFPPVT